MKAEQIFHKCVLETRANKSECNVNKISTCASKYTRDQQVLQEVKEYAITFCDIGIAPNSGEFLLSSNNRLSALNSTANEPFLKTWIGYQVVGIIICAILVLVGSRLLLRKRQGGSISGGSMMDDIIGGLNKMS